ncbi:MAG: hypothetical protein IT423_16240 [Pirellulaceae bacterium]|nr:hypothetical protein [Pirellulaceae bacterium]
MKSDQLSDQQLQAFLDEGLPPDLMSQIEVQLRSDSQLVQRLLALVGRREAGVHSLGEIWRKHRLTCPTRQQLGGYLLGTLDEGWQQYIQFHLENLACRVCVANVDDLRSEQLQIQAATAAAISTQSQRRQKYFQSSAGYLKRDP